MAACGGGGRAHPLPKLTRIGTANRLLSGIREHLPGEFTIVSIDNVPVQIVAAWHRNPFIADERRALKIGTSVIWFDARNSV